MTNLKYSKEDHFTFHSENGNDYGIEIVSVNPYRPPGQEYAIDVYLDGKAVYDDVLFVGENFIDRCEMTKETDI